MQKDPPSNEPTKQKALSADDPRIIALEKARGSTADQRDTTLLKLSSGAVGLGLVVDLHFGLNGILHYVLLTAMLAFLVCILALLGSFHTSDKGFDAQIKRLRGWDISEEIEKYWDSRTTFWNRIAFWSFAIGAISLFSCLLISTVWSRV